LHASDAIADAEASAEAEADAAALVAAAEVDDSLDELLEQAARANEATPSTAADFRTVVRFMQSPLGKDVADGCRRIARTLCECRLRIGNSQLHRWRFVTIP
jgi:hypothetical protein